MSEAAVSLLILAGVIVVFIWNKFPVGLVAVITALTLFGTGLLTLDESVSGFGDPVVVFIASLFVVSEGIDSAGVTTWAGQWLLTRVGGSPKVAVVAIMTMAAVMSALISLNGAAAALIPMIVVMAMRLGVAPGRLLMPMAFAGSAGALLVLTGSPVNVLVTQAAADTGAPPFSFFSFTIVGLPLVITTIAVVAILGPRLLPQRQASSQPADLSEHADTLAENYELRDGFFRLRLLEDSPLINTELGALDLSVNPDVRCIAAQRGPDKLTASTSLRPGDVVVLTGSQDRITDLAQTSHLEITMRPITRDSASLLNKASGAAELVIPPRSPMVGEKVFPGMLRGADLVVLGVRRRGKERGVTTSVLEEGDSILVHGSWAAVEELVDHRDVLVVNSPDQLRRQAVPLGAKAPVAIAVLTGMIALLAFNVMPPAAAGLAAAAAMVLFRVVSAGQAARAVSWQTIILIGGLIPLSTAIQTSGAATLISDKLIAIVGQGHPILVLLALFLLTGLLGQFISNTATVLIIIPIAIAAATETHVSPLPILMAVAIAGSASFLTPVSTPANMMILDPGGYRFGDYWRLGLPLLITWLLVALLIVPHVWPL